MAPRLLTLALLLGLAPALPAAEGHLPRAPELRIEKWIQGPAAPLGSLRGRVVMLNFFSSVCHACEQAFPAIEELQKRYEGQGFQVVGVLTSLGHAAERQEAVQEAFLARNEFAYPVGRDEDLEVTFSIYGGQGTPYVAFVDRDGRFRGADFFQAGAAEAYLQELLAD